MDDGDLMMPAFSSTEVAEWSGGLWETTGPEVIEGVSNDSRSIEAGNLYFALKGRNFDGHDFIREAFEKGASGAVISGGQRSAAAIDLPLLCVDDPAKALRDIASAYRLKVDPEIVAITGSAGKSTVKEMTARIFAGAEQTASTLGNWNNDVGLPLSLLAMERSTRIGVFEIGMNSPGEMNGLCDILKPDWGVVTNVGPVHMRLFDSVESIANEKACLLKSLPADGVKVLNRDGGFFDLLASVSTSRVITVSTGSDADYVCAERDQAKKEAIIKEKSTGDRFVFKTCLPGEYNVVNAMLAIAVARGHGIEWEQIAVGFEDYTVLPMRWERTKINGINVINDAYNANPLSMRASIEAFGEERTTGRKWLILGDMLELGDKERDEHLALGEWIVKQEMQHEKSETRMLDGLIVVGPLGALIAEGAEQGGFESDCVFRCENNDEAAHKMAENIVRGDTVFLKASRARCLEEVIEKLHESRNKENRKGGV